MITANQAGTGSRDMDCPVTMQSEIGFTPPDSFMGQVHPGDFWHGSPALWTSLPVTGIWSDLPESPDGYSQKIFWWSQNYTIDSEPLPNLTVSGWRLDAEAAELVVSLPTNAYAADIGIAMLVGVVFPTAGCWEMTGRYGEAELTFVTEIKP